jgi:hypothetical protein
VNWAESAARGARFTRVWRGADGRVIRAEELDAGVAADLCAFVRERAAFARATAPASDDDWIDVAGIDVFLTARGLQTPPSVIMSRETAAGCRLPDTGPRSPRPGTGSTSPTPCSNGRPTTGSGHTSARPG